MKLLPYSPYGLMRSSFEDVSSSAAFSINVSRSLRFEIAAVDSSVDSIADTEGNVLQALLFSLWVSGWGFLCSFL
jgi:hypothetical protein